MFAYTISENKYRIVEFLKGSTLAQTNSLCYGAY